jgi:LysM repeat protein
MRHRPQLLFLAGALAIGAVMAPLVGGHAAASDRVVVVQPGQTLSGIALREGISVTQLVRLNGISDPNRIYAGQRLVVERDPEPTAPTAPQPTTTAYRVVFGDTLSGIALRHRTTISAIARANGIANASFIRVGQVLRIPGSQGGQDAGSGDRDRNTDAGPQWAMHRVSYGESLWVIARRYGTSVVAIAEANGIGNASFIRVGQQLRVPAASGGSGGGGGSGTRNGALVGGPTPAMPSDMAALVRARQSIAQLIVAEARRQAVPEAFALAVAWQESGWQPSVVSYADAIGVMQLLPATGEWVGGAMLGHPVNLWDPAQNVKAGVRLLKHYLARYGGDRSMALAAYYQGQTAADRHGIYAVSRPYIASILRLERLFAG